MTEFETDGVQIAFLIFVIVFTFTFFGGLAFLGNQEFMSQYKTRTVAVGAIFKLSLFAGVVGGFIAWALRLVGVFT